MTNEAELALHRHRLLTTRLVPVTQTHITLAEERSALEGLVHATKAMLEGDPALLEPVVIKMTLPLDSPNDLRRMVKPDAGRDERFKDYHGALYYVSISCSNYKEFATAAINATVSSDLAKQMTFYNTR